ncbi:Hypothetical predicted protein, partial [Paramuricea clavata]
MLPSGAVGKKFVIETTKWIEYWNHDAVDFKDIALKVLMVMPALLLQKPTFKSISKEHSQCLTRHLKQWEAGRKLPTNSKPLNDERLAKTFSKLTFEGKINAAIKLLDQHDSSGVVTLSQSTINELKGKHPNANDADPSILMDGPLPLVDPVMFQNITESTTIMKSTLRTRG